jgi:hypothetical protein
MGAALGRIVGETMYLWFPHGVNFSGDNWPIVPGLLFTIAYAGNCNLFEFG